MIGFQIFALILLLVFCIGLAALLRSRPGLVSRVGVSVILAVIAMLTLVMINPDISHRIAAFAGVGRGADMMIYLAILFLFFTSASLYLRTKKLQLTIVEISRHIAILEAETDVKS